MSGLLQRLAGQALGTKGTGAPPRIRPAMSVHAQVPVALPAVDEIFAINPDLGPQESRETRRDFAARHDASVATASVDTPAKPLVRNLVSPTAPDALPAQSHAVHAAQDRLRESTAPLPLLHEVMTVPLPSRAIMPAFVDGTSASQAGHATVTREPTEVHVHIGRIEVIAAVDPAQPKKARSSTPRQTMALADYLARGSRR